MLAAIGIGILAKQIHVMLGNLKATGSILELLYFIPADLLIFIKTADKSNAFDPFATAYAFFELRYFYHSRQLQRAARYVTGLLITCLLEHNQQSLPL